jgi:hypothetical protein
MVLAGCGRVGYDPLPDEADAAFDSGQGSVAEVSRDAAVMGDASVCDEISCAGGICVGGECIPDAADGGPPTCDTHDDCDAGARCCPGCSGVLGVCLPSALCSQIDCI